MIWYRVPRRRTRIGCTTPLWRMEAVSSARRPASIADTRLVGIRIERLDRHLAGRTLDLALARGGGGGSGSGMRAESPRPSALRLPGTLTARTGRAGPAREARGASCRYASAPFERMSYRITGWPKLGASARRMLRGTWVLKTLSLKCSRTSPMTCWVRLVLLVDHRQEDTLDLEVGIEGAPHPLQASPCSSEIPSSA